MVLIPWKRCFNAVVGIVDHQGPGNIVSGYQGLDSRVPGGEQRHDSITGGKEHADRTGMTIDLSCHFWNSYYNILPRNVASASK